MLLDNFNVHSKDGLTNILKSVRFTIIATNGEKTEDSFRPVTLDDPDANSFVDYKDLTQETVLQWVIDKIGQDEVDALKHGLDSILNAPVDPNAPPVLTRVDAPWSNA
jgi:hypothetical protein